jgi:hypothetical protein
MSLVVKSYWVDDVVCEHSVRTHGLTRWIARETKKPGSTASHGRNRVSAEISELGAQICVGINHLIHQNLIALPYVRLRSVTHIDIRQLQLFHR